jgi:hypothetical protein
MARAGSIGSRPNRDRLAVSVLPRGWRGKRVGGWTRRDETTDRVKLLSLFNAVGRRRVNAGCVYPLDKHC